MSYPYHPQQLVLTPVTISCCPHETNSTSLTYQKPQPQICGFLQKSNLNRGIFYAARLISAQLSVEFTNDGSDKKQYDNMKKVYSIWICMNCPEDKKESIINYSFEPHIIYQGNDKLKVYENCDLMNVTFIHLSGKPDQSHYRLILALLHLLAEPAQSRICKVAAFYYIIDYMRYFSYNIFEVDAYEI